MYYCSSTLFLWLSSPRLPPPPSLSFSDAGLDMLVERPVRTAKAAAAAKVVARGR
jgi:hypothetical protein